MVDSISRWIPDRTPVQPKVGPSVPKPGANTNPYGASAAPVARAASQYDAVKQQLERSLNGAAEIAVSASYSGIDRQGKRSY
jgi:hypothetical protein